MKEIKFRVWDKRDDLHQMLYLTGFVKYGSGWIDGSNHKFYELVFANGGFSKHSADDVVLMLFIGLLDSKRQEIYCDDILKCGDDIMLVVWREDKASFALRKKGWAYDHYFGEACDACECTIIGNIHETPHFL